MQHGWPHSLYSTGRLLCSFRGGHGRLSQLQLEPTHLLKLELRVQVCIADALAPEQRLNQVLRLHSCVVTVQHQIRPQSRKTFRTTTHGKEGRVFVCVILGVYMMGAYYGFLGSRSLLLRPSLSASRHAGDPCRMGTRGKYYVKKHLYPVSVSVPFNVCAWLDFSNRHICLSCSGRNSDSASPVISSRTRGKLNSELTDSIKLFFAAKERLPRGPNTRTSLCHLECQWPSK